MSKIRRSDCVFSNPWKNIISWLIFMEIITKTEGSTSIDPYRTLQENTKKIDFKFESSNLKFDSNNNSFGMNSSNQEKRTTTNFIKTSKLYFHSYNQSKIMASIPNKNVYGRKSKRFETDWKRTYYFTLGMVSLIMNSSLFFAALMRSLIMGFNLPIGIHSPLILFGVLFGFTCRMLGLSFLIELPLIQSFTMSSIVVPIVLYKMCFFVDLQRMKKNIFQTLVISGPGLCANAFFIGVTTRYLLNKHWDFVTSTIFGTACAVIYPKDNMVTMDRLGPEPQHISTLLKGETIFGTLMAFAFYNILLASPESYLEQIQAVVIYILRYILGGIIIGYIIGKINCFLFRSMFPNFSNIILLNVTLPLVVSLLCTYVIGTSGMMAILFSGILMHTKRTISDRSSKFLMREHWQIICFIAESIVGTAIGTLIGYDVVWYSNYMDYVYIILIYCTVYCARFLIYVIFSPITSRLGYGMSFRCLTLAVWGGTPSLINICIALLPCPYHKTGSEKECPAFFYVVGMVVISLILNISTLSSLSVFLKMETVSPTHGRELKLCSEYLKRISNRSIVFMKIENLMADTAWTTVELHTMLRRPSTKQLRNDADEEEPGENVIVCTDCKQEIFVPSDFKENIERREQTRLRLLHTRESLVLDYFDRGLINERSFNTLSLMIRAAFDHPKKEMKIDSLLELFRLEVFQTRKRSTCYKSFPNCISHEKPSKPPNAYWRRLCYHTIRRNGFHVSILTILCANMLSIITEFSLNPDPKTALKLLFSSFDAFFLVIFTSECLVNVAAHSVKSFWRDGFRRYLSPKFNILDFAILITVWVSFVVESFLYLNEDSELFMQQNRIYFTLFKSFRLLRFFEYCNYPTMLLKNIIHLWKCRHLSKAYDIGKDFWIQEKRLMEEILPLLCDDPRTTRILKIQIEQNLEDIMRELLKVQHQYFRIALAVKTKYAIKLVVESMISAADKLMFTNWIDITEHESLSLRLRSLMVKCERLRRIKEVDSEQIFMDVEWLYNYPHSKKLFREAEIRDFNSGETLFEEGAKAEGVYVILSGTCRISYIPDEERILRLKKFGELPILDNIISSEFEEIITHDNVLTGMTLGVLSFLTGRSYASSVTAVFPVRALFVPSAGLMKVIEEEEELHNRLENRMWKYLSKNLSASILHRQSKYKEKRKLLLGDRLLCVNCSSQEETYSIPFYIENAVLIEGIILDMSTSDVYKAPCIVPRTVTEIVFTQNPVQARVILILPE